MTHPATSRYDLARKLYESSRTLVCRGRRLADGKPVILKILKPKAATEDAKARFRREFDVLLKIDHPNVAKAYGVENYQGGLMMTFEDIGGLSLDRFEGHALPRLLPLERFLPVAIGLADVLEDLHRRRIIHRDIRPAHIVFNAGAGQFRLIGFGLAGETPQTGGALQPLGALGGALAYISPERTGRMNRTEDYRTDFYSLGATFYEMLTGRPPFESEDALGMVHCHIARTPAPPHTLDPAIPETVSDIVMKLLAKAPEDRYQSGLGLKADLERCLHGLTEGGAVPRFGLGLADLPGRLRPPRKLYGREKEMARLLAAFERTTAGSGLLLVAGHTGVGKTALVREMQNVVLERQGRFIEGKFDQLQHKAPYSGWLQAFDSFVSLLLMASEADLAQWKQNIMNAVRSAGSVLTDVIRNLDLIIGPQPPVPELGGAEAQNRFNYVFLEFVRAIATSEHPLVIFLDDLQWADGASLRLLRLLLTSGGVSNLLIVGACRDTEIHAAHPLSKAIDDLELERAVVERLNLSALSKEDLGAWFADSLGCAGSDCEQLAGLLYAKTAGNPFFTLQMLRALEGEEVIAFDRELKRWKWDIKAIGRAGVADNVVDLMSQRLRQLPPSALGILRCAACLGARFDLATLSAAAEKPAEAAFANLEPAIAMQLIVATGGEYRFVHDRVQQAAYSLLPGDERLAMHRRIGRLLLDTPPQTREQRLFDIADHLNIGTALMATQEEKAEVAEVNMLAGQKAKARAAFATALEYLEAGLRLLGEESWRDRYRLMLAIHQEAADAACICGGYSRMKELAAAVHLHASCLLDEVPTYETEIRALTAQGELLPAIRQGLSVLERLGLRLPEAPSGAEVEQHLKDALCLLQERTIEKLPSLPPMTSPDQLACISILSELGEPAYAASPQFFLVWASVMAGISLRHGNCPLSPFAYAAYALALCATGAHVETGSRLARAAISMLEPLGARSLRCRLLNIYGCTIQPWTGHIRDTLSTLQEAIDAAPESGDFTSGSYAAFNTCTAAFFMGEPLDRLTARQLRNMNVIAGMKQTYIWNWVAFHVLAARRLAGVGDRPEELGSFDEDLWLASAKASNDQCGLAYYFLNRLIAACLLGETEPGQALAHLAEMKARQAGFQAAFAVPVSYFYGSLALLKYGTARDTGALDEKALDEIRENRGRLEGLARLAPMNFQHKCDLIGAELARIEGKDWEAAKLYEKAIAGARRHGFIQEEALACELAGAFYMGRGLETAGQLHMRGACEGYACWRAWAKVETLAAGRPEWLQARPSPGMEAGGVPENLDLDSIMKATRAISGEMELNRLLGEVMRIVIENAGAQSGVLLIERDGAWQAAAKGRIGVSEVEIPRPVNVDESDEASVGVIRFVGRTKERVVLDDAAHEGKFVNDPHVRRHQTKSLLCLPLLNRGKLIGVLYLENSLVAGAFTREKIRLLEMVLSQAAISLENARIYEALRNSEAKYRRLVDTANEGVWALASDGTTTFVNTRMAEMLGRRAEEMLGRPLTDFMFEEDAPDHLQKMENRRRGISEHYERRFLHKNGQTVWTLAAATPIFDDERHFRGSFAMLTDITSRKRDEQNIFLLNFALNSVREAAFLIDENARFRFVNEWSCRILGYTREELLSLGVADINPDFPPERWPSHWRRLKEQRSLIFEGRYRTKDGRVFPVEIGANYFEYGDVGYNLALVRDITERKVAETKILQLNRELEQRVAQRTAALEQANKELESFSYSVSHDLRAPLRAIDGFSHILEEDYAAGLDAEGRRYLGLVRRGARQMDQLIKDILAFSRMSRAEIAMRTVNMTTLASEVFAELHAAAPERNIRFVLGPLPPARGDRAMIRQVLDNLLGNAFKYSATRPEAVIEVSGSAGPAENAYCVRDNGVGFDMRLASKLFGMFERLHSAAEFEGTGIGLAIVKRIVERHGGRVWAEAKVGEGAAFHFVLPSGQDAAVCAAVAGSSPA